jgi:hypothetical protein
LQNSLDTFMGSGVRRLERATLVLVIVLIAGVDAWLLQLRCQSSPPIDWPRLAFGITVQTGVVAAAGMLAQLDFDFSQPLRWRLAMGILAAAACTFALVREPLLLSDTITDKFANSGSFTCAGVPQSWRRGP